MENEKLGQIFIRLGIAGLIASVIWWFIFFSEVNKAQGMADALKCLVVFSGPCGFIRAIASASGVFAYEPILFWISAAVLIVGVGMVNSVAVRPSIRHTKNEPAADELPPNLTPVETHKGRSIFRDDQGHFFVEGHLFSSLQNARAYINGTTRAAQRAGQNQIR